MEKEYILENSLISDNANRELKVNTMFFLLGNAALLCFNIILNAFDIYVKITGDNTIGLVLNRSYNFPNAITALILCFYKPKQLVKVLLWTFGILAVDMIFLPILMLVNIAPNTMKYLTMAGCALAGILSSIIFSNSFSISSQFGQAATNAVSSGNGCCGVLASLLRIITKAALSSDSQVKISSAVYYWLAAGIIIGTMIYLIIKFKDPAISSRINPPVNDTSIFSKDTLDTLKVIWFQWFGEYLNFLITLTMFSGYIQQAPLDPLLGDWTSVLVNTVFTIFDWIGRYSPNYWSWPSVKYTPYPILCRLIFIPIFMLSLQKVIHTPEPHWTLLWDVIFALSNGYCGTVIMVQTANHPDLEQSQKRFAGLVMPFAINAGILSAMLLTLALPAVKQ